MSDRVKKILKNPKLLFLTFGHRELLNFISDEKYLKTAYKIKFGKKLDLDNPQTFNEKLQWLKLYNRKPIYTTMVDKYEVKKYVADIIGEEYIIPTIGVWEKFEDIDFDSLPEQFVLKCTHDSGGLVICKDKKKLNFKKAKKKIKTCLKHSFFWGCREWPYKNVKPRIIAEKYMVDESGVELKDYKVLCFNGEPKLIELHRGRFEGKHTQDFYDCDWKKQPFSQDANMPATNDVVPRPEFLEQMLDLTRVLAKDMPHVRIDWYWSENQLYFGEITFFDGSGFEPFYPDEWDLKLGQMIALPSKKEG